MMMGKAIIEIFDEKGCVKRVENNMVTNLFEHLLASVSNLQSNSVKCSSVFNKLSHLSENYKSLDLTNMEEYSIRLLPETIEENKEIMYCGMDNIAYGSNDTSATINRGAFNKGECKALYDEQGRINGYRLVWDFPTNCANGTIKSISLVKGPCIGMPKNLFMSAEYNIANFLYGDMNRQLKSFSRDGELIVSKGAIIKIYNSLSGEVSGFGWDDTNCDTSDIDLSSEYHYLFKSHDIGDSVVTIGLNKTTNKHELIKVNKETKRVTNNTVIETYCSNYGDFSLVGDDIIIFSQYGIQATQAFYRYDIADKTCTKIDLPNASNDLTGITSLMLGIDESNRNFCRINYSRGVESRYVEIHKSGDDIVFKNSIATTNAKILSNTFGNTPIGIVSKPDEKESYIGIDTQSILTINNLSVPVNKTEANTMKVSYELRWVNNNNNNNIWTTKADMPAARYSLTSSAVDGKIYAIGGNASSNSSSDAIECYNPVADKWTTKTNMPTGRYGLTSSVVDGKIYAIGGYRSGVLNKVECYNPVTDTWTTKTNMPTARYYLTSSVVDGKIYAIGGYSAGNPHSNKVECYNPVTDTWETKADMPTGRHYLTSTVLNGKIYVIGGNLNNNYLNKVECYDPVTNTWETKANIPTGRYGLVSSTIGQKIYAIGGFSGNNLNKVESYDPITDTWAIETSMPTARYDLTSSVIGQKIYAIGGYGNGRSNKIECYEKI